MGRFRVIAHQSGCLGTCIVTCALTVITLLTPFPIQGQSVQEKSHDAADSATLQGSIIDSSGRPVADATVHLQVKNGPQTLTAHTDSVGSYRFSSLGEGVYTLRAERAGHGEATFGPCVLGPKEAKRIDLTLESPRASAPQSPPGASGPGTSGTGTPEFYDEPQFTVAGITEAANPGGHGSDTVLRTTEALTKETVSLDRDPSSKSQGDVEEERGNPLGAAQEYQRAAELKPSEPNLFDWGAELLVHRALEPAIEVFTKGNRLFPRSSRMLVGLGVAWYARGSYDLAAQRLCEASDLNPGDPKPYLFLGKMQSVEIMQSECTMERLGRFARLQPEDALANYYYAVSLGKRHRGPEDTETSAQVESLLQKAVHLDPKLGAGYLQLGILYSDRGDSPRAISAYEKAIAANPNLEDAHYRLAQAYGRTGEKLKAQQELQLYDQMSKQTAEEAERERREIQQFVYTLRDPTSAPQP